MERHIVWCGGAAWPLRGNVDGWGKPAAALAFPLRLSLAFSAGGFSTRPFVRSVQRQSLSSRSSVTSPLAVSENGVRPSWSLSAKLQFRSNSPSRFSGDSPVHTSASTLPAPSVSCSAVHLSLSRGCLHSASWQEFPLTAQICQQPNTLNSGRCRYRH